MAPVTTKNRWLIAASAVAIHISIGSAYAYSVFKRPLGAMHDWSATETSLAFTIAIFFLGASAAMFGQFVERRGPRVSAFVAATLFSCGHLIAAVAAAYGILPLFYVGYGVVGGIGLGIGYIAPVSTLVKWFPDRRGLATGMAVLGFGAGAMLASPIAARLIVALGVPSTFALLGIGFFVVMAAGALYIERPPKGWLPATMSNGVAPAHIRADLADLTAGEAIRTPRFWMLWTMMFINISAGIMLISVASPLAQETVGMSAVAAASMVGIMGLFNGAGRIGWAGLSDYVGRQNIFILFFSAQLIAFLVLPRVTSVLTFQVLIFMVLTMYGGGFASLPAFIGDLFGTRQLAAIHGLLLTSWSAAGIVGPMAVAFIRDTTGGYTQAFYVFALLLGVALVTSLMMAANVRALRRAHDSAAPVRAASAPVVGVTGVRSAA
jgi:MFS transporter, OFA family, oxalate/formate antiporter